MIPLGRKSVSDSSPFVALTKRISGRRNGSIAEYISRACADGIAPMVSQIFDQASAAMARGEIMLAARDGHALPQGVGIDSSGQPTTDPAAILKGAQLPFGGYKGSAIALMVEHRVTTIPVVTPTPRGPQVVGVLTRRDAAGALKP